METHCKASDVNDMHYSYSLVIKTIKIKNSAFFNSMSTAPMWFMSVASKGMHDSFSAASKLFCCTITLLLKSFTDYHNIYSLWTLNTSIKPFKRINRSSLHPPRLVILLNRGNMNRECSASNVLLLTHHPCACSNSARALP